MSTGKRIRELRQQRGWSQQDLADAVGVSRVTISYAENDKDVLLDTLRRIADALGAEVMVDLRHEDKASVGERIDSLWPGLPQSQRAALLAMLSVWEGENEPSGAAVNGDATVHLVK